MTHWLDPQPIDIPAALQSTACGDLAASEAVHDVVGGHPLVAQTLARRGIVTPEAARAFLDPGAYTPAPPTDLHDYERRARTY